MRSNSSASSKFVYICVFSSITPGPSGSMAGTWKNTLSMFGVSPMLMIAHRLGSAWIALKCGAMYCWNNVLSDSPRCLRFKAVNCTALTRGRGGPSVKTCVPLAITPVLGTHCAIVKRQPWASNTMPISSTMPCCLALANWGFSASNGSGGSPAPGRAIGKIWSRINASSVEPEASLGPPATARPADGGGPAGALAETAAGAPLDEEAASCLPLLEELSPQVPVVRFSCCFCWACNQRCLRISLISSNGSAGAPGSGERRGGKEGRSPGAPDP
mmetsp:Transcript_26553/g.68553  ORF Transcript_26553/g.68553 Transcript_26553/m.68553 type:complete len:273 (+) Transcript_26553:844-1662(+)